MIPGGPDAGDEGFELPACRFFGWAYPVHTHYHIFAGIFVHTYLVVHRFDRIFASGFAWHLALCAQATRKAFILGHTEMPRLY